MDELNIVRDEESELNSAWLPIESAYSRLTLLHYVRNLLRHAKTSSFHRLGEPKVPRPSDRQVMARVVPGDYFDDCNRLWTIALQQDIKWLRVRLPKLMVWIGLPESWGRIQPPDPEGSALRGFKPDEVGWAPFEHETRQCLIRGLTDIESWLEKSALETDLPPGWEPDPSGSWPLIPVRDVAELRVHLADLLASIQKYGSYPGNLDIMTRELRNTRRALRKFFDDVTIRPAVNDMPKDVFEAERELERLIDLLTPAAVRVEPEGESGQPSPPVSLTPPSLILNDTCLAILNALNGKSMSVQELANKVTGGETTRLYRDGMKTTLVARGLIIHDRKIGYYRPDAPPPERVAKVAKSDAKK